MLVFKADPSSWVADIAGYDTYFAVIPSRPSWLPETCWSQCYRGLKSFWRGINSYPLLLCFRGYDTRNNSRVPPVAKSADSLRVDGCNRI